MRVCQRPRHLLGCPGTFPFSGTPDPYAPAGYHPESTPWAVKAAPQIPSEWRWALAIRRCMRCQERPRRAGSSVSAVVVAARTPLSEIASFDLLDHPIVSQEEQPSPGVHVVDPNPAPSERNGSRLTARPTNARKRLARHGRRAARQPGAWHGRSSDGAVSRQYQTAGDVS